jgi:hypothetical protein
VLKICVNARISSIKQSGCGVTGPRRRGEAIWLSKSLERFAPGTLMRGCEQDAINVENGRRQGLRPLGSGAHWFTDSHDACTLLRFSRERPWIAISWRPLRPVFPRVACHQLASRTGMVLWVCIVRPSSAALSGRWPMVRWRHSMIARRKAKELGYRHDDATARHAREHGPAEGHGCCCPRTAWPH